MFPLRAFADSPSDAQSTNGAQEAAPAPKHKKVRYHAPEGFAGHKWEQPWKEFDRLKRSPVTVQIAYSEGKVTRMDFMCSPSFSAQGMDPCDLQSALATMNQRVAGRGYQLFTEFVVDGQGFRYGSADTVLYPVTYQFCASWKEGGKAPPDVMDRLKLCGVRMVFKSETYDQLKSLGPDHVTTYEHLLSDLIDKYGEPEGYSMFGHVTVRGAEGQFADPRERKFPTWRWCRPIDRDIAPKCAASITFGFNPESGNGVILYTTRPVWEFAYARQNSQRGGDPMYKFMHGKAQDSE
jgi:hypothetical protein